ncbi:hypothetical protein, partial [Ramlibacter sp.]|uniref:hypothetical protein n=1 Tax=Ramlibacter sp. TaxID=1917967 RepID=UPI0025F25276
MLQSFLVALLAFLLAGNALLLLAHGRITLGTLLLALHAFLIARGALLLLAHAGIALLALLLARGTFLQHTVLLETLLLRALLLGARIARFFRAARHHRYRARQRGRREAPAGHGRQ